MGRRVEPGDIVVGDQELKQASPSGRISVEQASPSKVISMDRNMDKIIDRNMDKINNSMDKINNITQKEKALARLGLNREKYLSVIAKQLNKKMWKDQPDDQGNVRRVEVDDDVAQRWAVDKLSIIFGDMIERKEIEHDLGDKTLDRFRGLSVADLKKRAADVLLGRAASRLEPIVDLKVVEEEE